MSLIDFVMAGAEIMAFPRRSSPSLQGSVAATSPRRGCLVTSFERCTIPPRDFRLGSFQMLD